MDFVGLVSGGKDSIFNIMCSVCEGHRLVCVANLRPGDEKEVDSYMYQSVGCGLVPAIAECMGVPLHQRVLSGAPKELGLEYCPVDGDEVEDLFLLLKEAKAKHPSLEAVSVGAILSQYQHNRVKSVCARLGLRVLAYLYQKDCGALLETMIACGIDAVLIKTGLPSTEKEILLTGLGEAAPRLRQLECEYGTNICGEGGEYETIVLDCPLYSKKLVIDDARIVTHRERLYSSVYYAVPLRWHLEEKPVSACSLGEVIPLIKKLLQA
uniref:Diphthine--ammonia ligase n=1 Tax=Metchnikovella dogieli TaxID=2804710 RepID=A0A896WDC9_9MICR|nr:diphthine-ammonia ligase [Metchnikovella dogieli]